MKKLLLVVAALVIAGSANARSIKTNYETFAPILSLEHNGGFPVAQASVTYQPSCGDSFRRVEQSKPEYNNESGVNLIKVRVVVNRNVLVRCIRQPNPATVTFEVLSDSSFELVASNDFSPVNWDKIDLNYYLSKLFVSEKYVDALSQARQALVKGFRLKIQKVEVLKVNSYKTRLKVKLIQQKPVGFFKMETLALGTIEATFNQPMDVEIMLGDVSFVSANQ